MGYLLWRQHRNQLLFALGVLCVLTAIYIPTGIHAADAYRTAAATCASSGTCDSLGEIFSNYAALFDIVGLSAAVPALFGLFWGAPLIAREVEHGTHQLAWTQAVTRRHWLTVKLGWLLAAAAVWGAAIGALIAWWSGPANSLYHYRFQLGHFDTQGIVPIAYSVFALVLGAAISAMIRRTLPALAVTLGVFTGLRFGTDYLLRPHYLPALTTSAPFGSAPAAAGGSAWTLSTTILTPTGQQVSGLKLTDDAMPAPCRELILTGNIERGQVARCLGANGYRTVTTYQPASRFWTFQAIECGIYLVLAAALVAVTIHLVRRRDA